MADNPERKARRIECETCGRYHGTIDLAPLDEITASGIYDVPEGIRQPAPFDPVTCQACHGPLLIGGRRGR